ncbi:purine-nucleoside phosphorylase, partial [Myxococcus sp. CA039A]|nr:purine-nucleoside phosphorylase [Myxococcus sp. CA039A]
MEQNALLQNIKEAAEYIRSKYPIEPEIGLVLGSGLGVIADMVQD